MKRSLLLAGFLALCMSTIYALPHFKVTPSAMRNDIPESINLWKAFPYQASERERQVLANDTEFTKAHCVLPRREEMSYITGECPQDVADLSIVLSGDDLSNSIHRPERCMAAQGHEIVESVQSSIQLPNGRAVDTRRLVSILHTVDDKGNAISYRCLTYYFFVGHQLITSDHMVRNNVDMKDRLLKGEAQHWAYVLATMPFGEGDQIQRGGPLLSLQMADQRIQSLLGDLTARNIDWQMIAAR